MSPLRRGALFLALPLISGIKLPGSEPSITGVECWEFSGPTQDKLAIPSCFSASTLDMQKAPYHGATLRCRCPNFTYTYTQAGFSHTLMLVSQGKEVIASVKTLLSRLWSFWRWLKTLRVEVMSTAEHERRLAAKRDSRQ